MIVTGIVTEDSQSPAALLPGFFISALVES
jgi:hypothetical protein